MAEAQSPAGSTGHPIQPAAEDPSDRPSTRLVMLGFGLAIAAAGSIAFCRMYSTFPWYDDDGYLLITLRSFLGGHPLYDETYTNYGPFFYLWRLVIHGLGVPLTHDATRGVALFEWGLCGLLAALLLRRSTGDDRFGLAGGILVFLFLEPVTKEPSHPQLLAVVVTLGAALAFSHLSSRRGTVLAGLLVGALLAIKPNLGIFAGLGLALVQARCAGAGWGLTITGLAAAALPVALMRAGFAEPTVIGYAAISALAPLALVLDRRPAQPEIPARGAVFLKEAAGLALGAGAAYAAASAFALSRGTSVAGLMDGVLLRPVKFAGAFAGPAPFPVATVVPACLAALTAIWIGRDREGHAAAASHARHALGLLVLGVVSIGYLLTACTVIDQGAQTRAFAGWVLAIGTPWAFLLRPVAPEPGTAAHRQVRAREMLIALAVAHLGIGFPAAGTQLSCGAALFVLAALPAAHDALTRYAGRVMATRVSLAAILVATAIPALAASATYRSFVPIDLPGASLLRVDDALAAQFRAATTTLRTNGGPFVTVYGFNSLYLWTQLPPPTPANATLWPWMLNGREQTAIVRVLEGDTRSVALVVSGGPYLVDEATNQVLGRWIRDHTAPAEEVGPMRWQLRRPRGSAEDRKTAAAGGSRPE